MRKTAAVLFILLNVGIVNAQNLVVGFTNPNEILNLNSGSYTYDTVFLFNNATLNINNQTQFVVNSIFALFGTSKLNAANSYLEINNTFFLDGSSTANLSDSLNLSCNLYVTDYSSLNINEATVDIPMTYKNEFGWWGLNDSSFEISNSVCNLGAGALQGAFVNSANFAQVNNQYISDILPITLGIAGNSNISVDNCSGGMEFVISDSADVTVNASDFFVIWYSFADGDTANYDYPPANSVLYPLASNIVGSYHFSDNLPNVSGIDFSINIQDADGVFWGIISKKNSSVEINNSTLLACGFYFDENSSDTASGFINAQLYPSYTSPFSDRGFSVNNTMVNAWNFYPSDTSELIIDNCVYGESIGFANGTTKIFNSVCDGTGGYLGGSNNSRTYVYSSEIIRIDGTAQIINYKDSSFAWFYNSSIIGDIVLSENTHLFFGNTDFSNNPLVNQNAYFAQAWFDTISNVPINSNFSIIGKIWGINGELNNSSITRYIMEYSLPDSSGMALIIDTVSTSFNIIDDELANWNTNGITDGNYLLWLSIFADGDTAISCNRSVILGNGIGINENNLIKNIKAYPNPTSGILIIEGENIQSVEITNANGQIIERLSYINGKPAIDLRNQPNGFYFVTIKTADLVKVEKIVLKK